MNEIVIDASCILAFLLNQDEHDEVLDRVDENELAAPSCIVFEIGNALSKLMRRGLLSVSEAVLVYHEFCKIPIRLMDVDVASSMIIAGQDKAFAYDAYYISLAEHFSLPLYTLDRIMKANAQERGIKCL